MTAAERAHMQTKKKKRATDANTVGDFHLLSQSVPKSLTCFAKEHAKEQKERFGKYLKEQFQTSTDKENRYLDAMVCLHLYHSPSCYRSAAKTRRKFAVLGCESERLRILKQQL